MRRLQVWKRFIELVLGTVVLLAGVALVICLAIGIIPRDEASIGAMVVLLLSGLMLFQHLEDEDETEGEKHDSTGN